ncbi:hypothetical protein B4135_3117 [Caldibacillus debilis]|uniref:Uncharacterized protein n=1 Tax=Caldibacillus debilis TaxID=301148 RepID=A0A150LIL6_9BACI|nr:hypothetical protein B4135_3117 [Caldibacillus debilis]
MKRSPSRSRQAKKEGLFSAAFRRGSRQAPQGSPGPVFGGSPSEVWKKERRDYFFFFGILIVI